MVGEELAENLSLLMCKRLDMEDGDRRKLVKESIGVGDLGGQSKVTQ